MDTKIQITDTLKIAMKAREMEKVKVLRNLQAEIKKVEIDSQNTLDNPAILALLQKQVKQRQESLAIFSSNGRDDLAQKEQFEIDIISQFLPAQLSEDELAIIIQDQISTQNATSIKDMGKVVLAVKTATAGQADPTVISALVKKFLA